MSGWSPQKGDALHIPSGPSGNHLFVVLNDPIDIEGYPPSLCLLVCICSINANIPYDQTCVLNVGQHPSVLHPSYVAYKHARLETSNDLSNRVCKGVFNLGSPFNDPPLSDIKNGLYASIFTKNAYKAIGI